MFPSPHQQGLTLEIGNQPADISITIVNFEQARAIVFNQTTANITLTLPDGSEDQSIYFINKGAEDLIIEGVTLEAGVLITGFYHDHEWFFH